jgi:hypothetical protein
MEIYANKQRVEIERRKERMNVELRGKIIKEKGENN